MKQLTSLLLVLIFVFSCVSDDGMTIVETPAVVAEFKTNLSELNLYSRDISDLIISPKAFEYEIGTPLFSDYAHKERLIALPDDTSLQYNGDGLPIFPDNTVIAKTFYYNLDERDLSTGRQIIETRVLIKSNGIWEYGDYKWNADQTEAVLDPSGSILPITWIDIEGNERSTQYEIPSNQDCFSCHSSYDNTTPIGPKLRSLNFDRNGVNQLQNLINTGQLIGITEVSSIDSVPNWQDLSYSVEERSRAYFEVNCAHCHIPGGFCDDQSTLNLDFSTPFSETNIVERKQSISFRISENNPGFSMPFIGTTLLHEEGISLIQEFLDSL